MSKIWICDGVNPAREVEIQAVAVAPHRVAGTRWYIRRNRLWFGNFEDEEWAKLKELCPDAVFSDEKP